MSRGTYGKNRACFTCRIKYPGYVWRHENELENQTTLCSVCGSELDEIPDWLITPKKKDVKGWNKLHVDFLNGNIKKPISEKRKQYAHIRLYPEQSNQVFRFKRATSAIKVKSEFESILSGEHKDFVIDTLRKYIKSEGVKTFDITREIYDLFRGTDELSVRVQIDRIISSYYFFNKERAKKRLTEITN